jgi:hypothetical protein
LGGLVVGTLVFLMVNIGDYFRETWVNNWLYAMPRLSQAHSLTDYYNLFIFPLRMFENPPGYLAYWGWLVVGIWLAGLVYFIYKRSYWQTAFWLIAYVVWFTTNLRDLNPGVAYYEAFHLIPWWIMGLSIFSVLVSMMSRSRIGPFLATLVVGAMLMVGLMPNSPLRSRIDPDTESYIQYSPYMDVGFIINTLKNDGDKLLVHPHEVLLHWLTDLPPATAQVTFYEWQYYAPNHKAAYDEVIPDNPPRFIQYTDEGSPYGPSLKKLLNEQYVQIFDIPTLYIRTDTIGDISEYQWQRYGELQLMVKPVLEIRDFYEERISQ